MSCAAKIGYRQVADTTTVLKATPAGVVGIICVVNSTVTLYDNATAGSGVVLFTKAMTAGEVITFGEYPVATNNGLTAVVATGTANILYT